MSVGDVSVHNNSVTQVSLNDLGALDVLGALGNVGVLGFFR